MEMDIARNLFYEIRDLFFPRICFHCNENVFSENQLLCNNCLSSLITLSKDDLDFESKKKFSDTNYIKQLFSLYKFGQESAIQTLIHELKYQNKFNVGRILGTNLANKFLKDLSDLSIDYIIPVPLHNVKKAERGYNQSYFIAKGISKVTQIKIADNILVRNKFTSSQTLLNKTERELNVKEAFALKKTIFDKNILLVDDVITTGATINACAKLLNEIGIENIYAASIALA